MSERAPAPAGLPLLLAAAHQCERQPAGPDSHWLPVFNPMPHMQMEVVIYQNSVRRVKSITVQALAQS